MPRISKIRLRETETYTYHNANPKNKLTGDCVLRAIATFTDQPYQKVLSDLVDLQIKTGYMINDKKCYEKYLSILGYEKQKQPKHFDNTKYTGSEWAKLCKETKVTCLCRIGSHHLTVIKDGKFQDIWNPSNKCVNNYWI